MNFNYSEEQNLLSQSLSAWFRDRPEFIEGLIAGKVEKEEPIWETFAEMGWLGLCIDEAHGGAEMGREELAILGEVFGENLVGQPYLSTAILGAKLISLIGSSEQKERWLADICEGKLKVAFAAYEGNQASWDGQCETEVRKAGDGYVISGRKNVVFDAPRADKFLVVGKPDGSIEAGEDICLVAVDAGADGVTVKTYTTVDGRLAADVAFENAACERLSGPNGCSAAYIEQAMNWANIFLCAEALGVMRQMYLRTLEYVKIRKQFGQFIGDFQVIKHKLARMRMYCELARGILIKASTCSLEDNEAFRRIVAAARVQVGLSGRFVGQNAVHLHGAIGMTDELAVGHYFKRLIALEMSYGDMNYYRRIYEGISFPTNQ